MISKGLIRTNGYTPLVLFVVIIEYVYLSVKWTLLILPALLVGGFILMRKRILKDLKS